LGAAANYLSFYLVLFVVPFYCREILNLNAMQTGAYLTIMPVLMMLSAPISGALSDRFGSRVFSMLGMLITTVSLALLGAAARPAATSLPSTSGDQPSSAGLGSGFFVVPNNSAIMGAASRSQQGVASGVLATFRYLGMIAGTTVGGSLFDMIEKLLMAGGAGESTAFRVSFTVTMGVGVLFGILGFLCASAMSKKAKAE
jgi:MFS family permease